MTTKKPRKQTTDSMSSIAAKILRGEKATQKEMRSLAGSVLSQDEKKGLRRRK